MHLNHSNIYLLQYIHVKAKYTIYYCKVGIFQKVRKLTIHRHFGNNPSEESHIDPGLDNEQRIFTFSEITWSFSKFCEIYPFTIKIKFYMSAY